MRYVLRSIAGMLICSTICLSLSGCWSSRELSELAVTMALGIDKKGDEYQLSMQVADPSQVASSKSLDGAARLPVTLYIETGDSVNEILHKVTTVTSRKIYLAHLRMLIIGEELAREGINQVMDYFDREHELRTDFFIAIARNARASDVLSVLTPMEKIPAIQMYFSLETSERFWAPTQGMYIDQMIAQLTTEGEALALTGIRVVGDPKKGAREENLKKVIPDTQLEYTGFGVFKLDKLTNWLTTDESRGYNYFVGKIRRSAGTIPFQCGHVGVDLLNAQESLQGKVIDGKPHISFKLQMEVTVNSVSCSINLDDYQVVKELEETTTEHVKKILEVAVAKQREIKLDFLTFGAAIHRHDPKGWRTLDRKNYAYLDDVEVTYDIECDIRRVGTRMKTFISETKE